MSPTWSPTTKRMILVGVVVALAYAVIHFSQIIPPLLVAFILSYILQPFVELFEVRLRLPRTAAVALVYFILVLLLIVAPASLVPFAIQEMEKIDLDLQQFTDSITQYLSQPLFILNYQIDLLAIYNELIGSAQDFFSSLVAQTVGFLFDVAEVLIWIILVFVVSFYLLKDVEAIVAAMDRLVPPDHLDEFRKLRHEINEIWHSFFRAQIIQCLVIGIIVGTVMAVAGVRDALVLAIVAAVCELVPKVGHTVSGAFGMIFVFFQGPGYHNMPHALFALLVGALYTLVFFIDTNYILPRILGRRVHLHPLVVIVGIIAGAKLGGALGMFAATPTLGMLRVLGRYVHHKLLDMNPFPEPPPPENAVATTTPDELEAPRWRPAREIQALLFDLDGTLLDTDEARAEALAGRLKGISRLLPSRDPHRAARRVMLKTRGPVNTLLTAMDVVGLDENTLGLADRLRRFRGERTVANFQVVPGATETLHALEGHYRLGIVTARGKRETEAFLAQYQLTNLFEVVVTHESTPRLKPHPEPVRHAAEMLGLSTASCAVVGDTTADIHAAKKAGAWAIGVLCGLGERAELEAAGADLVLDSTAGLAGWLVPQSVSGADAPLSPVGRREETVAEVAPGLLPRGRAERS